VEVKNKYTIVKIAIDIGVMTWDVQITEIHSLGMLLDSSKKDYPYPFVISARNKEQSADLF